jgi:hypothetical protein
MKAPKLTGKQTEVLNHFSTEEYTTPTDLPWNIVQQLASMGLLAEKAIHNAPNQFRRKSQKEIIEMLQKV